MKRSEPFSPRSKKSFQRPVNHKEVHQRILIVCEGTKTEPQYFKQFRVPGLKIQVEGTGKNTVSLVEHALQYRKDHEEENYDQVWCVFDKDDFPVADFEKAIRLARKNKMCVAYSNQAFELWYILHFEYLNTSMDQKSYIKKLNDYLETEYKKNDDHMYHRLRCKSDIAIKNAERLMKEYHPSHPGSNDPSTTVYELVKVLLNDSKLSSN